MFCHGADDLPQGFERLVLEAFSHIEVIGPHVAEGYYDIARPDGDIILPSVWEQVVVPGMSITMHLWPLPERTEEPKSDKDQMEAALEEAAAAAAEAAASPTPRARMDVNDPRWIPPPTVVPEGVFGFPKNAGIKNNTQWLHLALFELYVDHMTASYYI